MVFSRTNQAAKARRVRAARQYALNEVSARLREAREYRHLTLEAVALATKLPSTHIQAMESGDLRSLPGRSYSRAFVRTYASYLGLDADELLAMLPAPAERPPGGYPKPPERPGASPVFWVLVSAAVLIVSCVGYFALQTLIRATGDTVTQTVLNVPTANPSAALAEQPPPPTPTPIVRITVRGTNVAPAPLQITIDGQSVFSGTLAPGQGQSFSGNQVVLNSPNAGGIEYLYNGGAARVMGQRNQAQRIELGGAPAPAPDSTGTPSPTPRPLATSTPTPPRPTPTGERPR